jgi:predicted HTH transcriptional regulator
MTLYEGDYASGGAALGWAHARDGLGLGDVRRLAAMGEGPRLEFKKRIPEGSRVAKEVTAMANAHGGRLLIGVTDEGAVVGVRDSEEEEYSLQATLEAFCDPPVPHKTYRISISRRKEVILVEIPESPHKPHYVLGDPGEGRRQVYVRIEDMSVVASREAVRLMRHRDGSGDVRFEFGEKELVLMRYLDEYGRISVEQFARIAGVPRRAASHTLVLLTRAGLLVHHMDPGGDYFSVSANGGR